MKKTILFSCLFILTSFLATAQVQKLNELTSGKFLDSRVIMEEDNDDVFGYIFLYEKDRSDKRVYEYEYVILDKNLNKLSSKVFTQSIFRMGLINLDSRFSFVVKKEDEIIFGLHEVAADDAPGYIMYGYYNHRYRKINLKDFSLSNTYYLVGNILNEQTDDDYQDDNEDLNYSKMGEKQTIFPLAGDNFLLFGVQDGVPHKFPRLVTNAYYRNSRAEIQSLRILNSDFETLLNVPINQNAKNDISYNYDSNDEDVLIIKKRLHPKFKSGEYNYEAFDIKTGKAINEFKFEDKDAGYKLMKVGETQFTEDHVIFFFDYYGIKDKIEGENKLGIAKYVFDKKTFNVHSKEFFSIEDMSELLTTDPKRRARDLYFVAEDFKTLENGKTIAFIKYFYKRRMKKFEEFYTIEFDENFKVSKDYLAGEIGNGVKYGHVQKLDGDGNYAFFHYIVESRTVSFFGNITIEYSFGITSYVDGEFEASHIPLQKHGSKIHAGLAKNGYIRIIEETKDKYELRLERINY